MEQLNGYDNIFENEALYFWGNMKVLFGAFRLATGYYRPPQ